MPRTSGQAIKFKLIALVASNKATKDLMTRTSGLAIKGSSSSVCACVRVHVCVCV